MNWLLLKNSLLVSAGATLLAVTAGFFSAVCLAGLPRMLRRMFVGLAVVVLALPPFVVANSWLYLLGPTGVWRSWLPINIMSLAGTAWVLGLMLWPIALLAVLGTWHRLEPQLVECDMAVRGRYLIWRLLFPLARSVLLQVAVLIFVLALNNFAVPALLQVKVFPAEIWIRFSTSLKPGPALWLSWPLVLAPLLLLAWVSQRGLRWPHVQNPVPPALFRRQLGRLWGTGSAIASAVLFALSAGLPLVQLAGSRLSWIELPGAAAAGQSAIGWSFFLSALSATVVVSLGLAPRQQRTPGRRSELAGPMRRRLALLMWIPFLVPGVLLGILFIILFNRGWLAPLYSSVGIVVLAYVVRYLAPGTAVIAHARGQVGPALADVARLEGASRWQMLRHVEWPQIAPQVAAAWYVVFLLCLWDVESILLIVPPGVETLALRIFNLLHYGHNPQVDALCLTLLALAITPLCLWVAGSLTRNALTRSRIHAPRAVLLLLLLIAATGLWGCAPARSGAETVLSSRIFDSVRIIGTRGTGVGQLNKPRSVAVDLRDNLYVVDMTGRVQKFSSNGVFVLSWQMPETDLGKPKGMCRDAEGNIVVLEPHYARVNHFSPSGMLVCQWGTHGTNVGSLSVPRAVAVDARDGVFVTEYQQAERVQKFVWDKRARRAGAVPKWVMSFGKAGTGHGEFSRPEGVCVDAQGRVYVADSCNHRIQVFSGDGQFLYTYGKPGNSLGELSYPYDICVDPAGRQYVCEFGNSRIQVFDSAGRPLEIIGGPGREPGRFSNPWGVALDSAGNLYVADSQNHRVQKLIRSRDDIVATKIASLRCDTGLVAFAKAGFQNRKSTEPQDIDLLPAGPAPSP